MNYLHTSALDIGIIESGDPLFAICYIDLCSEDCRFGRALVRAKGRGLESEWPKVSFECQRLCTCLFLFFCDVIKKVMLASTAICYRDLKSQRLCVSAECKGWGRGKSNYSSLILGQ